MFVTNFNDWEQRKLGDGTDYVKGFAFKSKDYRKSGVRIIRVSDLARDKIKHLNNNIFISMDLAELNKKYRINKNEIIITTVGSKAEMKESAVGRPIIVNENGHFLLNQNLVKITVLQGYDNYFIYSQLLQPRYTDYIAIIERGNANQANIAINDLWEYRFLAPKEVEQQQIGAFFKTLDNTIALHQEKLEKLKQLKKGYLQVMFPKTGEKNPQLRFANFHTDWEQRKAKNLFQPVIEKGRPELPVLSVTQDSGIVYRDEVGIDIKYDPLTLKNYKVIHPGDFVISLRSFQGGFEVSDKLGITSPAYTIFVPKYSEEQDRSFWKTQFKTFKFIESLKTVTFGIRDGKSISFSEFSHLKLSYPSRAIEQQKIGSFFRQLNQSIVFQQRKITTLQETKKIYLKTMFI